MDSRVFDLSQGIHSLAIESSFKFGYLELNLYVSRLISRDIQVWPAHMREWIGFGAKNFGFGLDEAERWERDR